ncbi:MAG: hypothetical protein HQM02_09880, partial [Magnetococcales bacterium]|nr:hypothetical protein [Magnetococcales bacterium]
TPIRYYYMFRNAIWMFGQPHIPHLWSLLDGLLLLIRFACALLFREGRRACVRMMVTGVAHGLRGLSGPFPGPSPSRRT